MKACYLTCAVLLAVACAGCASNRRRDVEQLERELRYLEDKVFLLESDNAQCCRDLESAHRENEALLRDAGKNGTRADSLNPARRGGQRLGGGAPILTPPDVVLPDDENVPPFEGPPVIQPPDPNVPEGESADEAAVPTDEPPPLFKEKTANLEPGANDVPLDSRGFLGKEGPVSQITLNRRLTGGHNIDGQPGDEGVMVVVEPLDAAGELIEAPGDISVVVLDPARQGDASRVARWDFTAAEAARHLKRTPMGDGLHFTMPWPHSPPVNRTLTLYVRYTTSDGRQLQAEKQIEIDPPGKIVPAESEWTRTPSRFSESIADDGESGVEDDLPRGRAKDVRPLTTDDDGDANSVEASKTGLQRSSRGTRWTPYR
jgi:hypothetical protein